MKLWRCSWAVESTIPAWVGGPALMLAGGGVRGLFNNRDNAAAISLSFPAASFTRSLAVMPVSQYRRRSGMASPPFWVWGDGAPLFSPPQYGRTGYCQQNSPFAIHFIIPVVAQPDGTLTNSRPC